MPNTKLKEAITKLRIIREAAEYYNDDSDREALALAIHVLSGLDKIYNELKPWKCDNPNCGNGAVCNFCALRSMVNSLLAEE